MNGVDGRPAAPALAAHLAVDGGALCCHRFGNHRAQVEIALNALVIMAGDTKNGPRMLDVYGVFDLAGSDEPFRIVVSEVHGQ